MLASLEDSTPNIPLPELPEIPSPENLDNHENNKNEEPIEINLDLHSLEIVGIGGSGKSSIYSLLLHYILAAIILNYPENLSDRDIDLNIFKEYDDRGGRTLVSSSSQITINLGKLIGTTVRPASGQEKYAEISRPQPPILPKPFLALISNAINSSSNSELEEILLNIRNNNKRKTKIIVNINNYPLIVWTIKANSSIDQVNDAVVKKQLANYFLLESVIMSSFYKLLKNEAELNLKDLILNLNMDEFRVIPVYTFVDKKQPNFDENLLKQHIKKSLLESIKMAKDYLNQIMDVIKLIKEDNNNSIDALPKSLNITQLYSLYIIAQTLSITEDKDKTIIGKLEDFTEIYGAVHDLVKGLVKTFRIKDEKSVKRNLENSMIYNLKKLVYDLPIEEIENIYETANEILKKIEQTINSNGIIEESLKMVPPSLIRMIYTDKNIQTPIIVGSNNAKKYGFTDLLALLDSYKANPPDSWKEEKNRYLKGINLIKDAFNMSVEILKSNKEKAPDDINIKEYWKETLESIEKIIKRIGIVRNS